MIFIKYSLRDLKCNWIKIRPQLDLFNKITYLKYYLEIDVNNRGNNMKFGVVLYKKLFQ